MIEILVWTAIFMISIFVLIKASDFFTQAAERIGLSFGLPVFIVGVTIVAIGTSLPELMSSIVAIFDGVPEIVLGNVVGSNITNIFLVLGVAAILGRKIVVVYELGKVDLPMLVGTTFLLAVTLWDGYFSLAEALLCLAALVLYLLFTIQTEESDKEIKKEMKEELKKKAEAGWKVWAILIISAGFIYLGAEYTVQSVIMLSRFLGLGADIIALSAVALGTSLPELSVTVVAARAGKPEIAIGNVLGSTIFNSLAVTGIPRLFGELVVTPDILSFAIPLMLVAVFMFFFMIHDRELTKWEGGLLVIFYFFFIGKLFGLL